jgi:[phosphatase 2A protein]-leucine-carboxy methyltransferase
MMIRRPPWVNIGTHHRTYLIDELVSSFLAPQEQEEAAAMKKKQVVSLGAGSDSRFWRLKSRFDRENNQWPKGRWVETDLQPTVTTKIEKIVSNEKLSQVCGEGPIVLRSDGPDPTSSSGELSLALFIPLCNTPKREEDSKSKEGLRW